MDFTSLVWLMRQMSQVFDCPTELKLKAGDAQRTGNQLSCDSRDNKVEKAELCFHCFLVRLHCLFARIQKSYGLTGHA